MGTYKRVEGLSRGLEILRLISSLEHGRAKVSHVATSTALHRTTAKRIMETLREDGYLRYDPQTKFYTLSLKTRQLSEGFVDETWIVATATPALAKLQRNVVWPTDLVTPQGDKMIIRETTRRFSPFSFHRSMVGMHIPMLTTSVGRAYLAYCSDQQRSAIASYLMSRRTDGQDMHAVVDAIGQTTREQGYGSSFGDWAAERRFGAIAAPIRSGHHVWGCINVVFLLSSMSAADAAQKFTQPLWDTANEIADDLVAAQ